MLFGFGTLREIVHAAAVDGQLELIYTWYFARGRRHLSRAQRDSIAHELIFGHISHKRLGEAELARLQAFVDAECSAVVREHVASTVANIAASLSGA